MWCCENVRSILLLCCTKDAIFWQIVFESYIWQMSVYLIPLLSLLLVRESQISLHASSAVAQFRAFFKLQLLFAHLLFFSSLPLAGTSHLMEANPAPAEPRAVREGVTVVWSGFLATASVGASAPLAPCSYHTGVLPGLALQEWVSSACRKPRESPAGLGL